MYCRFAQGPEPTPKTALYCRTATQDDFAIKNQSDRLAAFALTNGYDNLDLYIDNSESGTTLCRPAMNRLIDDIQKGTTQTVIVTNISRIARGFDVMLDFVKVLNKADVPCVSLDCGWQDIRCEVDSAVETMAALLSATQQGKP